jgi:hypothetical protein
VFITHCFLKILRKPSLQINQLIFYTLINSSFTYFRTVFLNKILITRKYVKNFLFYFSNSEAQLPNKCLHFISHYNDVIMLLFFSCILGFKVLNFSKILLKYANLEKNVHCENFQHVLYFILPKTALLLLAKL